MQYAIITTSGEVIEYKPRKQRPVLEELQQIVGGYIERVRIRGGHLWVNEEGRIRGLPLNARASLLAGIVIVGNVLLCERDRPRKK